MDPQIRMLLELTFESLESAGIPIEDIAGSKTSVFAGTFTKDYHDRLLSDPISIPRHVDQKESVTPSTTEPKATGEEKVWRLWLSSGLRMPSGTVIQSVTSFDLIKECYEKAGLDPRDTIAVEAHGTGTTTGDPIEAEAIGRAFSPKGIHHRGKPVLVASVKTNIGHTEAASGLAAVIKMAKSLEHGQIAPSLNFERVNPNIDLHNLGLEIPLELGTWPADYRRRASVNNFGYGGTNSHVIMENAPERETLTRAQALGRGKYVASKLFFLSARDEKTVLKMASDLRGHLELNRHASLNNLAFTLGQRRSRFHWSLAVPSTSLETLMTSLSDNDLRPVQALSLLPKLGFVLNGQGAQWFAMGRELMELYPTYLATLRKCQEAVRSFGGEWSLIDELRRDESQSRVDQVQFSMPLTCAVQIGLVCLLEEWGVRPAAVTGHSTGEVAAAFTAGAVSLEEAMAITFFRGLLNSGHIASNKCPGSMMAVGMGPDEIKPYLDDLADTPSGKVVIACFNSPSSVTLSGDMAAIEVLEQKFNSRGIFARKLKVQAAFHSHHMVPLAESYGSLLVKNMNIGQRSFSDSVKFYSPTSGSQIQDASLLGPGHWVENMLVPVHFTQSFSNMLLTENLDFIVEHNKQGFNVSAVVHSTHSGTPVIEIEDMHFQSLGHMTEQSSSREQTCLVTDWKRSFILNDSKALVDSLRADAPDDEKTIGKDLVRSTFYLISDALKQLTAHDISNLEWHHQKLHAWMLLLEQQAATNELAPRSSKWASSSPGVKQMHIDKVERAIVGGALSVRIGKDLVRIMRREAAPLELMMRDQLLYDFYQNYVHFKRSAGNAATLVRAIAEEKPRDPADQGFQEASYDIVIAAQVLHATKCMKTTMGHVKRLLKDDGKLILRTMDWAQDVTGVDTEYAVRKSEIFVPRICVDDKENEALLDGLEERSPEAQPFEQPNLKLRMHVDTPGLLDSIVFREDPDAGLPLPEDYVEIKPRAFGLNFHDVMAAMGMLKEERQEIGVECAGVVTQVGPHSSQLKTTHGLRVGDRVCALTAHGHFANTVRVPWTSVARIPPSMTFETAASFVTAFVTAYYSLFEAARCEDGDTLLIHAASGGVGQACIILAQWKGIEIFVTAGTQEKRDFLKSQFSIPPDHIFSSRDDLFPQEIRSATAGRGVDAVIISLAGNLLNESWNLVAPLGRFLEIGKKDVHLNKSLEMEPFRRALSFMHVDIIQLADNKGHLVQRILQKLLSLLGSGAISNLTPVSAVPLAEAARAFRTMQAGNHIGKIVLVPGPDQLVKVIEPLKLCQLRPDVSYMIVGGLSGIGQSIARWFISRGARNLLLVSRNAASRSESSTFIEELAIDGARIMVKNCDVGDLQSLKAAIDGCRASGMPDIRGVVQGGMVLDDSILERMSFSQWNHALNPKVSGTKNIEELLGHDLDFFILLSSRSGVLGYPSQANYAAGNTYLDAVARRRGARGLPCVAIDLGPVKSVGFVAETQEEGMRDRGHRPLSESEVLGLVDYAIRNPRRPPRTSQIAAGISSAGITGNDPRLSMLQGGASSSRGSRGTSSAGARPGHGRVSLHEEISRATSLDEAANAVQGALIAKISDMFVLPETDIDPGRPLSHYGVDSLVAVELTNWLVPNARVEINIFDLIGSSSLSELAANIVKRARPVLQTL
ncbi:hypothetical protein INS49_005594 [Diaporthe citri]|uniref:uncharacterized protein n=1 Tax=Diaporthe citri TaxID=83186 RepID=UPI001C7F2925|nr:uncharacterized protein INS49_005594 [Diaporthe citri]KAG6353413.1 hypothetical protein INS49_005594 [Diaporthe citri]